MWSCVPAGSCLIYGDEGEWIATCSSPQIAAAMVDAHNFAAYSVQITIPTSKELKESRRFSRDVDAIVDIVDNHLAQQALPIHAVNPENVYQKPNNGWRSSL